MTITKEQAEKIMAAMQEHIKKETEKSCKVVNDR